MLSILISIIITITLMLIIRQQNRTQKGTKIVIKEVKAMLNKIPKRMIMHALRQLILCLIKIYKFLSLKLSIIL